MKEALAGPTARSTLGCSEYGLPRLPEPLFVCVQWFVASDSSEMHAYYSDWYTGALSQFVQFTNASTMLSSSCRAAHKDKWLCALANYSLPYIKTPIFTVQQMVSTWDAQCMGRGQIVSAPTACCMTCPVCYGQN